MRRNSERVARTVKTLQTSASPSDAFERGGKFQSMHIRAAHEDPVWVQDLRCGFKGIARKFVESDGCDLVESLDLEHVVCLAVKRVAHARLRASILSDNLRDVYGV